MPIHALLHGLVVIRHDHEVSVDARVGHRQRQIDRLRGRIRTRPGQNGQTSGRDFDGPSDEFDMLIFFERRGFSGRTGNHQSVAALGNVKFDQPLESGEIDPIMVVERRHQSDQAALQHKFSSLEMRRRCYCSRSVLARNRASSAG